MHRPDVCLGVSAFRAPGNSACAHVEVKEARIDAFFEERFALCGQILMRGTRRVLRV
jgi:hypothetical protein